MATGRTLIGGPQRLAATADWGLQIVCLPVLHPNDYERWLAPADSAQLPLDLLRPYPDDQMKVWKVGKDVGNVKNNRPDLGEPVP